MIRCQYAILAEYAREGTSGKIDILGAFDRVFAKTCPAQHGHCVLLFLLVADTEDALGKQKSMRLTFETPSGKLVMEQQGPITVMPSGGTWLASARLVFEMVNLPLPVFGKYLFRLQVDGEEVATHPLSVMHPPQGT